MSKAKVIAKLVEAGHEDLADQLVGVTHLATAAPVINWLEDEFSKFAKGLQDKLSKNIEKAVSAATKRAGGTSGYIEFYEMRWENDRISVGAYYYPLSSADIWDDSKDTWAITFEEFEKKFGKNFGDKLFNAIQKELGISDLQLTNINLAQGDHSITSSNFRKLKLAWGLNMTFWSTLSF